MTTRRIEVGPRDEGTRLDQFLARPLGSRARAQRVIDLQGVRVDGRPVPKRHRVATGEMIEIDPEVAEHARGPETEADDTPAPSVVYEDDDLLVVDKPAGLG